MCSICTIRCTLYIVYCTMYHLYCTLYTLHCTLSAIKAYNGFQPRGNIPDTLGGRRIYLLHNSILWNFYKYVVPEIYVIMALHFQLKTLQITMVCTPCYLNSHCRQTSRSGPYCSMECRSRLCGGPPVQIDSSTMQFEAPVVSDHNFDGQPPWAREVTNLTTWRGCKQDCLSPGF